MTHHDHVIDFSGSYDETIIDDHVTIPDKSPEFKAFVVESFAQVMNILMLYPRVNRMSSYFTFNAIVYKISCNCPHNN